MNRRHRALATMLLALALLPATAMAQGEHGGHDADTAAMMESLEELRALSGEEFEAGYVNRIIPHHEGAVEMAEMVVDRAPHEEVRRAAARIVEDQEREIEQLTSFLRDELGEELDRDERQAMADTMMGEIEDAEPEMAEKMFLLMMREHHQSAVEMGGIAIEKATSGVIREQAEQMVRSQREEQAEFAGYLQQFYGIQAPEPTGDMTAAMELAMDAQMPGAGGGAASGVAGRVGVVALGIGALLAAIAGGYALRRRAA